VIPGIEHRQLRVADGTTIAYQVRGAADRPAIVFANGLGGTYEAFVHLYSALGDRYRLLCWDYRGLYRSGRPRDLGSLAIPSQVEDLRELLDRENIQRAVFIGWSMGVQVNFELARRHRARMAGLVVLSGTYGSPFRTALASRLARYFIPPALTLMKARHQEASWVTQQAVAWNGLLPAMAKLGLLADCIDREAMNAVIADFKTLDFAIYADTLQRLGQHDARDVLPTLGLPTLILTGDRDLMTPVFTARKMNKLIPGSRLVVVPGASHYAPLEYPKIICEEVRRTLAAIPGWEAV
jgi:pimeloyl-ACP methyl ester carboxylesterase